MGITETEFDVLVDLLHAGKPRPATNAAKLVLVYGATPTDAMTSTGCTRSTVHDAVKRYRNLDQSIREAYQIKNEEPRLLPPFGPKDFDFLVTLLHGKPDTPANKAARLVLLEGKTQAEAGRITGATRSTVCDAVGRYSKVDQKITTAYGITRQ